MRFSNLNIEATLRKYATGELSSEEHLEVGDLIRENKDWRLAWERYLRSQSKSGTDFATAPSTRQSYREQTSDTSERAASEQTESNSEGRSVLKAPAGWLRKFLSGYGVWFLIFLLFKLGPCIKKNLVDIKDKLRGNGQSGIVEIPEQGMIATDLQERYGRDSTDEQYPLIVECTQTLAKAEKYNTQNKTEKYISALMEVANDDTSPCKDEALYLAASALLADGETDYPMLLLSKLTDQDHFGADAQWLIARCFVVKAKAGEVEPDKAERAIVRAMAFPENAKHEVEAARLRTELGTL